MTSSFASDAPPTGRHGAWNFPYNGWILLSDSDQSEESRGLVGLSSARSSRFAQSEQSSLHVVDGHPRGVTKGRRRFLYHKTSSDAFSLMARRRFAYHSCVECRKKTNQGCVQHPTAKTTARYCLRIQLKQEDISMWSTMWPRAF